MLGAEKPKPAAVVVGGQGLGVALTVGRRTLCYLFRAKKAHKVEIPRLLFLRSLQTLPVGKVPCCLVCSWLSGSRGPEIGCKG